MVLMDPCTVLEFFLFYGLFGALHEVGHVLAGLMVGCRPAATLRNFLAAATSRQVCIETKGWSTTWVRHAGWVVSVVLAAAVRFTPKASSIAFYAALVTALEACLSDLLQLPKWSKPGSFGSCKSYIKLPPRSRRNCSRNMPELEPRKPGCFSCGNFGIVILNAAWTAAPKKMKDILEAMVEVT